MQGGKAVVAPATAGAKATIGKSSVADKNANDIEALERQQRIESNLEVALLGISKLNIAKAEGKVKLTWGSVNNCDLNTGHIAGLARSIQAGKQPSRYPIYVAIKRSWIDVGKLSQKQTSYTKLVEPTYKSAAHGQEVKVLSGHHRHAAVEMLQEEYEQNMDKAKSEIAKLQRKQDKAHGTSEKLTSEIEDKQGRLEGMKKLCVENGLWQAEWYDDGKQRRSA